jgi:hypothetical protein
MEAADEQIEHRDVVHAGVEIRLQHVEFVEIRE